MLAREIELSPSVEIHVNQNMSSGELGATVWDAALTMIHSFARFPQHYAAIFDGASVLDLSCGTGVCGIAAARLFEGKLKRLVLTDMPALLPLVEENVAANKVKGEVLPLKWGEDPTALKAPLDVILMSDVVVKSYSEHYAALLASMTDLTHDGSVILLAVELREPEDKEFLLLLGEAGFSHEQETRIHPGFVCDEIRLFRVRKQYGPDDRLYA